MPRFPVDPEWQRRYPHSLKPLSGSEYAVFQAAGFLIAIGNGHRMETLRVHRLLYIGLGFSLLQDRHPLFYDPVEAWINGPVVMPIYELAGNVPWLNMDNLSGTGHLLPEDGKMLGEIFELYGKKTLLELDNIVCGTGPWSDTRLRYNATGENRVITHELMKKHFQEAVNRFRSEGH